MFFPFNLASAPQKIQKVFNHLVVMDTEEESSTSEDESVRDSDESSTPSSTSSSSSTPKRKKRKKLTKKKKKAKKKSKSSSVEDLIRLAKVQGELRPLSHYVGERSTLLDHIWASIPATQLKAILPPALKGLKKKKLKSLCLNQLKLMPESQLLEIIKGGASSSSSTTTKIDSIGEKCKKEEEEGGCQEDSGGKTTLMELLELEMRARAIKALLKKEEEGDEEEEDILPDPSIPEPASIEQAEEDGIQDIEIELGISSDDEPSGT